MKFVSLEKCREFFNLMMLEHEVKGILECASLELWTASITHGSNNETHWETVKILTGKHGEIFIFNSQYQGTFSLAYDIGNEDGGCAFLDTEIVNLLEIAVANDYIPVGLLTAISDFRRDTTVEDSADNFLMTYSVEVDAALKMIRLFHV